MHWLSVMRLAKVVRGNVDYQLLPNGRSREAGAVATLIAILFGTGVLLGLGALVIDTGSLLYERRQLQNGADAVALAIAKTCASAPANAPCAAPDITNTPSPSPLVALAGANAADQKSDVASVCGSAALVAANPSAFPTVCATLLSPGLVDCPVTTSTAKYVEVRTSTRTAVGTILPPILAQMLAGGNYSGETVKACARAGWGPLGNSGPALPLVIGVCEYNKAVANGLAPAPKPQYTPAPNQTVYRDPANGHPEYTPALSAVPTVVPTNTVTAISAHTTNGTAAVNNCPADQTLPAGQDYPGGFGWAISGGNCSAVFTDTGDLIGNGGGAPPQDCKGHGNALAKYVGTVVNIPIFTNVTIANGTGTYTISGLAAFYLAGYANVSTTLDMFGYVEPAPASAQCVAGTATTCVWGWFTEPDPSGGSIGGGTERGPLVIQVLG